MAVPNPARLGSRKTTQAPDYHREFWDTYLVDVGDLSTDPIEFAGIPALYSTHPDFTPALLIDKEANTAESSMQQWNVKCHYTTKFEFDVAQEAIEDPIFRPARLSTLTTQEARSERFDANGKPYQNSAGEWYNPLPVIRRTNPGFRLTKNIIAPYNLNDKKNYEGRKNSAQFLGFKKGELYLADLQAEGAEEKRLANGTTRVYFVVTGTFHVIAEEEYQVSTVGGNLEFGEGHDLVRPDMGFYKKDSATGELIRQRDFQGPSVISPVALDGTGEPNATTPLTVAAMVYNKFAPYKDADFNELGLLP